MNAGYIICDRCIITTWKLGFLAWTLVTCNYIFFKFIFRSRSASTYSKLSSFEVSMHECKLELTKLIISLSYRCGKTKQFVLKTIVSWSCKSWNVPDWGNCICKSCLSPSPLFFFPKEGEVTSFPVPLIMLLPVHYKWGREHWPCLIIGNYLLTCKCFLKKDFGNFLSQYLWQGCVVTSFCKYL